MLYALSPGKKRRESRKKRQGFDLTAKILLLSQVFRGNFL